MINAGITPIKSIYIGTTTIYRVYMGEDVIWNQLSIRTQNLLEYAISMGYAPPTDLLLFDEYIRKMNPILDKMDLFYIFFGDGDINFKLLNIVDPLKYKGTAYGGLTWDDSGVRGNGLNGGIRSNLHLWRQPPEQKYKLDDAHRGGIIVDASGDRKIFDGTSNTGGWRNSYHNRDSITSNTRIQLNSTAVGESVAADVMREGLNIISRPIKDYIEVTVKEVSTQYTNQSTAIWSENDPTQDIFLAYGGRYGNLKISTYHIGGHLTFAETQLIRQYTNEYLQELGLTQVA